MDIARLRKSNDIPFFLAEVAPVRQCIERILNEGISHLSDEARKALESWHSASQGSAAGSATSRSRRMLVSAPQPQRRRGRSSERGRNRHGNGAVPSGRSTSDMIRAAADSLIAWAESTVSQDSNTIIVVQPLNETATRAPTSIDTPPTLLSADASILKYLAEQQGDHEKYRRASPVGSDLSRKTVGRRLRYLREHGYVKHPEARTRGHIITT